MEVVAAILHITGWSKNLVIFTKRVRKETVNTKVIHQKAN